MMESWHDGDGIQRRCGSGLLAWSLEHEVEYRPHCASGWLFADPILANSALDRLANGAQQLGIEAQLPRPPRIAATRGGAHEPNAAYHQGGSKDCRGARPVGLVVRRA